MSVTKPEQRSRIRGVLVFAAVLLIGFLAVRYAFLRAADRLLDDWAQSGLPGSRLIGTGPAVAIDWPPVLKWGDLFWEDGDAATARCSQLELGVDPSSVLKRNLLIDRVRIDDLYVQAASAFLPGLEHILSNLPERSGEGVRPERPYPDAVRIEIAPIRVESLRTEFRRIEGWAWSERRGSWEAIAQLVTEADKRIDLRIEGSGTAGYEELILDANLSDDRSFRYRSERPVGERRRWTLTGRDDGNLLLAMLLPGGPDPDWMSDGVIDFELSGSPGSGPAAEIHVERLQVGGRDTEPWNVRGLVCVADGVGSLEDVSLYREDCQLSISAEFPITADRFEGSWLLAGEWEGEPLRLGGTVSRHPDAWILLLDGFQWRDARTGQIQLSLSDQVHPSGAGRGMERRLRGQAVLGTGLLSLEEGWGTEASPALLRSSSVPVSWLEPLLPFSLPGDWSGAIDGWGRLRRVSGAWKGTGRASLEDGSIQGITLLEEIGALVGGGRRQGIVRLDELSLRWSFDSGRFFADSMNVDARTMRITGSLMVAPPDSIFGLLRVAPSGNSAVAAILGLLGGKGGAIDLGVMGTASRPEIIPILNADRRGTWLAEVLKIRRRFASF